MCCLTYGHKEMRFVSALKLCKRRLVSWAIYLIIKCVQIVFPLFILGRDLVRRATYTPSQRSWEHAVTFHYGTGNSCLLQYNVRINTAISLTHRNKNIEYFHLS